MAVPYAFVTLITSDAYLPGALTVAAALNDVHPSPPSPPEVEYQTVCLVTPETVDVASVKLLRRAFDVVVGVEIIDHENNKNRSVFPPCPFPHRRPDLTTVLTKLHVFRLTQYSKIIFLDADVLPIRPLSHLFTIPHEFSAVPDVGWPDIFNSGVLVLSPGEEKFTQLTELLKARGTWDGGDQGLLNEWRGSNWNRLSFTYNTTPTAAYTYAPAYERFGSQISAVHFIGANKPWHSIPYRTPFTSGQSLSSSTETAYNYDALVDRWFAVYDKHYRAQSILPPPKTEFQFKKYVSVWNEKTTPASHPPLGLHELKRLAIEGINGSAYHRNNRPGEGDYLSLPLNGRITLMRPKRDIPASRGPFLRPARRGEDSTDSSTSTPNSPLRSQHLPTGPRLRPVSVSTTPTSHMSPAFASADYPLPQYPSSIGSPDSTSPSLLVSQSSDVLATPDSYFSSIWDEVADLPTISRLQRQSSPDKSNVKTIFPWEEKSRQASGRVFPSDSDPSPVLFPTSSSRTPTSPEPQNKRQSMLSPLQTASKSLGYSNAWDTDPTIKKYATKMARPPTSPLGLAPAFSSDEWRKVDKEYKNRDKSVDADSRDGDVEDEGEDEDDERRRKTWEDSDPESSENKDQPVTPDDSQHLSRGIQTIPRENQDEAIQVYPMVEVIAERKSGAFRGDAQQAQPLLPPVVTRASSAESTATVKSSRTAQTKQRPITASVTDGLSPVTPPPSVKPADRPSAVTRQISNDSSLNSPASSVGPNSPADGQPLASPMRKGGRVWDPARGVDVFKRGSEEVLARFLKMGSWEEEAR
uniref:glycogenin glucosyltransferase n=1 Tax=Volvariella volvacea TaxID=36659 RepID=H6VLE0_9AGAR|nr:glycogenin-1 [Volvariella volvacea]